MSEEKQYLDVYKDTYDKIKSYTKAQPGSLYFSSDKPTLFFGAGGSSSPVEACTLEHADSAVANLKQDVVDLEDATDTKLSEMFKHSYLAPSRGLQFALSDDESYYSVISVGTCTDSWVVIPETYNGLPVTTIASRAFASDRNIQVITCSKNIKNLNTSAIVDCTRLVYIEFLCPDSITFGTDALDSNKYLSTFYSENRDNENIKSNSFQPVNSRATLVDGKYLFCERGANCVLLTQVGDSTHVVLPNAPGAEGTKYIVGRGAFSGAGVKSIKFSESVKSINVDAFSNNTELTAITIPDVMGIGEGVLDGCSSLEYLDVPFVGMAANDPRSITYLIDDPSSITTLIVRGGVLNKDTLSTLPSLEVAKFDTDVEYSDGYAQLLTGCSALKQLDICFPKDKQDTPILLGALFSAAGKTPEDDNHYAVCQGEDTFKTNYSIPKSLKDVTIHGYIYRYSLSWCASVTNWTIDTKWNNFYTDGSTINSDMNMFAIQIYSDPSMYPSEFPKNVLFNITIDYTSSPTTSGVGPSYVSLPRLRPFFVADKRNLTSQLYCKARFTLAAINVPEDALVQIPTNFYSNNSSVDSDGTIVFYEGAQLDDLSIITEENPLRLVANEAEGGSIQDQGDLLRVSLTGEKINIGAKSIQAAQDRIGLQALTDPLILHIKTDTCSFEGNSSNPSIKTGYEYGDRPNTTAAFRAITIEHEIVDPNEELSISVPLGCLGTSESSPRVCVITDKDSSDKWETAMSNSGLSALTNPSDSNGYSIETRR